MGTILFEVTKFVVIRKLICRFWDKINSSVSSLFLSLLYKYYKLKLLTPIGLHPFRISFWSGFLKIFLLPMKFLRLRAALHSKSIWKRDWYVWLFDQKDSKRQKVRSISQLCLHCVYIPKTRGNPGNLTPSSFLRGANIAWGSLRVQNLVKLTSKTFNF